MFLVLFRAAQPRSEATMQSNIFGNMILGTIFNGQGSTNAVGRTHRSTLRSLVAFLVRGLALRLGKWQALAIKCWPAEAAPALAVCPSYSASRRQRHERWMSGVAVDSVAVDCGTVGVR
jgi:hypothetical protein